MESLKSLFYSEEVSASRGQAVGFLALARNEPGASRHTVPSEQTSGELKMCSYAVAGEGIAITHFQDPFLNARLQESLFSVFRGKVALADNAVPSQNQGALSIRTSKENSLSVTTDKITDVMRYPDQRTLPCLEHIRERLNMEVNTSQYRSVVRGPARLPFPSCSLNSLQESGRKRNVSLTRSLVERRDVTSPQLRSVHNEKLPCDRPFRASLHHGSWSISFAIMFFLVILPQTLALPAVIRI
ncbi:hypothetical protein SK128_022291, partial [Halocaridina rubra]